VKIVKNLLSFARRKKPQKNPFELRELIEKTVALRAYELKVKNIKLALSIPDGLPMLYGDFQQLQQVFLNIILNAEKSILASDGEGKLSISARHDTQKEKVVIEFFDSGKPVPAENLTRIFDPYFKGSEGDESGLGLAIAYGIVGDHRGTLMLRNLPVKGKVFTLDLPAYMGSAEAAKESPVSAGNGAMISGRKILVVDDDESICSLIKNIIEKEGGIVRTVNDASKALGELIGERFDLIICDIKMPGMSGIELAGNLISSGKIDRGNIILMTGDTLSQETQNQIESSGLTAMTKPFNISELKFALAGKTQ
ncbi:MAG: response regulator, partial [Deltaproteobacteria bacterium]|nr:response regulator [Deltaproteobacteria bacterium]